MTASVTEIRVGPYAALELRNKHLRAVVIPQLGGRVWELEDLVRRRQWIWHSDAVGLTQQPPGADYDTVWAGGWEELFPNDAAGDFEGRQLHDHGEWWASPWTVTRTGSGAVAAVELSAEFSSFKARCTKKLSLEAGSSRLRIDYEIHSLETQPRHFLLKQHLPVALHPRCRLRLPGGLVEPVSPGFGTLIQGSEARPWPCAGSVSGFPDLSHIPAAQSGHREFVYVQDLPRGLCAVDDESAGASLEMSYDTAVFPYVWLFMTYGGWRNENTAVLEPCTNKPKDLAEAVRLKQAACLEPGGILKTSVSVALLPL